MPAQLEILIVGSDNLWTLDELTNLVDDSFILTATVTCTVFETDGTTIVTGESFPLAMPFVAASNGKYQATLPDALALVAKKRYIVETVADDGAGFHRVFRTYVTAHRGTN